MELSPEWLSSLRGCCDDSSLEQRRYRASGLTLVTAAIALWNTVYIKRAVQTSARNGQALDPELFKYLSPLGCEHINLTGDYQWKGSRLAQDRFRSLRTPNPP
jgi:Tn3 transposase DDE domain